MYWPDIPVKSAAVGLKASLMPMAGSTDLRLNLFCILNLQRQNKTKSLYIVSIKSELSHPPFKTKSFTSVGKCPSWSCAGRCPRTPAGEQWAGTPGRRAASSSRWAAPPAGSGSGPGTAAPTPCSADLTPSWTDLARRETSSDVQLVQTLEANCLMLKWVEGVSYRSWPLWPGTSWAPWWCCRQRGWRAGSGCWWRGTVSARPPWRPPCWPGPSAAGGPTTVRLPGPRPSPTAPHCCFLPAGARSRLVGNKGKERV